MSHSTTVLLTTFPLLVKVSVCLCACVRAHVFACVRVCVLFDVFRFNPHVKKKNEFRKMWGSEQNILNCLKIVTIMAPNTIVKTTG